MELRIRVGAAADASLVTVFRPLFAASAAAQRKVEQDAAKAAGAQKQAAEAGAKAQAQAADKAVAAQRSAAKVQADLIRSVQQQRNREHQQFLADVREQEREARKAAKAIADEKRRHAKEDREAGRVGSAAMRTFGGVMRRGAGVARDIAGGLGVDFSLQSIVSDVAGTETRAAAATRSAMAAQGKVAGAADFEASVQAIKKAGDEATVPYDALGAGFEAFISKSSDLETLKQALGSLGKIARVTGSDVAELVSAAGDVNKELADGPDKAERLLAIMRLIASQSAKGNVEVKDYAKYLGRVTATAFMYEGSKEQNIGILGALAQVATRGGAAGPAEATRSAQAFARDLTKGSALKNFEKAGIDVFANKERTALRTPEAILTEFLGKTKGDFAQLANLFKNDASRKIVLGFENIYKDAGGGDAGIAAVRAEFQKFTSSMSAADIDEAAKVKTKADEAVEFQNQLRTIVSQMLTDVMPAMRELAPVARDAAKGLAGMVSFAAQNPGTAITAAIVASIAKESIGKVVAEKLGTAIGGLGATGLTLGALTLLATTAYLIAKEYEEGAEKAGSDTKKTVEEDLPALLARAEKQRAATGMVDRDTADAIMRQRANLEGLRNAGDSYLGQNVLGYAQIWAAKAMGDSDMLAGQEGSLQYAAQNADKVEALAAKMDAMIATFKGSIRVHVENVGDLKGGPNGPGVDGAARGGTDG